jgi:hypothetical protein
MIGASCAAVTNDTLEENAGIVVVVELGTVVVEVVGGSVVVDERTALGLSLQLAKRMAIAIELRPSATCFRTAVLSRKGEAGA